MFQSHSCGPWGRAMWRGSWPWPTPASLSPPASWARPPPRTTGSSARRSRRPPAGATTTCLAASHPGQAQGGPSTQRWRRCPTQTTMGSFSRLRWRTLTTLSSLSRLRWRTLTTLSSPSILYKVNYQQFLHNFTLQCWNNSIILLWIFHKILK